MTETTEERWNRLAAGKAKQDPAIWKVWFYEVPPYGGLFVTGAVCPPITRGRRKGEPNVKKRDRATECVVYLSREELA